MKQMIRSILQPRNRTSAANGGSPSELQPPWSLRRFVGGSYKAVGAHFLIILSSCADRSGAVQPGFEAEVSEDLSLGFGDFGRKSLLRRRTRSFYSSRCQRKSNSIYGIA